MVQKRYCTINRILAFVISIVLAVGMMPLMAYAGEVSSGGKTASEETYGSPKAPLTDSEAPQITTTVLDTAYVGHEYAMPLTAAGYPTEFTWSLAEGSVLPEGLSLTEAGIISGTATEEGTYTFDVQCTNGIEPAATATLSLKVIPKYKKISGMVYLSVSADADYVVSSGAISGTTLAYVPIDLQEVSAVDLDACGLGAYNFDANEDGTFEITALHLLVYAADRYSANGVEDLVITGNPHYSYLTQYIDSGMAAITYLKNGGLPLDPSLGEGIGASLDVVSLADGDFIDITMYSGYGVFSDAKKAGCHYFFDSVDAPFTQKTITHEYDAVINAPLNVAFGREFSIFGSTSIEDTYSAEPNYELFYGKTFGVSEGSVTTNNEGLASITFPEVGTWYLWAKGGFGSEDLGLDEDVVSSPAYAKVTVTKDSTEWKRLAGEGRYETMEAVVSEAFTEDHACSYIVVASGENFPDALTASGLAGAYDAPVILTSADILSPSAATQIERLAKTDGTTQIFVLGGENSISNAVFGALKEMVGTDNVIRIAGDTRYDTAVQAWKQGQQDGLWGATYIIADGQGFADALSVAPYAYASASPILLAEGTLNEDVTRAVQEHASNVLIVGGINSVNPEVESEQLSGISVERLSGENRYETSACVATWATGLNTSATIQPSVVLAWNHMGVASGSKFVDALTSSSLLGHQKAALLLVEETEASHDIITELVGAHADFIQVGYLVGGPHSVSAQIETWLEEATS